MTGNDNIRFISRIYNKPFDEVRAYVEDSGEGRWTLQEAIERGVPLPVITAALFTRFRSREENPFGERLLAALRQQFGGHAVQKTAADR